MAGSAQFTQTPKVGIGAVNVANTLRDGTGTIVTILTAAATGSRIDKVVVKATVTTTPGIVRLFIHNGVTASLLTEVLVTAVTVGASTPGFEAVIDFLGGLVIPTGYSLRASTHNAESFNVIAFGGDF